MYEKFRVGCKERIGETSPHLTKLTLHIIAGFVPQKWLQIGTRNDPLAESGQTRMIQPFLKAVRSRQRDPKERRMKRLLIEQEPKLLKGGKGERLCFVD